MMSELITARDSETWFDQRPTHSVRPPWLIVAQEGMEAAWKAYNDGVEEEYNAAESFRDVNHEKLNALCRAAESAQAWYLDLCAWYNRGEIPPSVKAAMEAEQDIPFDMQSDRIPDCVREDLGIIFKAVQ